jgi:hypothetical protein
MPDDMTYCYMDCYNFLKSKNFDPAYKYYEGMVVFKNGQFMEHGWIVYNGKVLELTFDKIPKKYYGIQLQFDDMTKKQVYGLLCREIFDTEQLEKGRRVFAQ